MLIKMKKSQGQSARPRKGGTPTLDPAEVERFRRMAEEWWDPRGKFRPLHQIGPARLAFIREAVLSHFKRDGKGLKPYAGLTFADIGCGGGLICEPLARLGGTVTGIDPATRNIEIARLHAEGQDFTVEYRPMTVEELVAEGNTFDCVTSLEVIEHVPDPAAFIKECARLVRPGGLMILSTINRTLKAYALAIIGAEYVLGWLPRGTHDWHRFITPEELSGFVRAAGMAPPRLMGFTYDPLRDLWSLDLNTSVNYLASCAKPSLG
jgi:2-polyprenyl-6-hydroxyphenyl methylase/3-demethylubiquinone-9 3-methyltransferase